MKKLQQYVTVRDLGTMYAIAGYLEQAMGYGVDSGLRMKYDNDWNSVLNNTCFTIKLYGEGTENDPHRASLWSYTKPNRADVDEFKSFNEFLEHVRGPKMKIGDYDVSWQKAGLMVGCTFVPWVQVLEIAAHSPKNPPAIQKCRCSECGYKLSKGVPGMQCPNCGNDKVIAEPPPAPLKCNHCHAGFEGVPKDRCPNCSSRNTVAVTTDDTKIECEQCHGTQYGNPGDVCVSCGSRSTALIGPIENKDGYSVEVAGVTVPNMPAPVAPAPFGVPVTDQDVVF
jgi:Zn finger protein HypA/HybF involved in hydrogenase expression